MTQVFKGWAIDIKALYGGFWPQKEKFHTSEDLWESPDGQIAGFLYDIAEVGVNKEVGRLAVFKNKEKPELLVNCPKLLCWHLYDSAVQFGKDGVLFVHRFEEKRDRLLVELNALDIKQSRIAVVPGLREYFYYARPVEGLRYGFKRMNKEQPSDETLVDLASSKWKPIGRKGWFQWLGF